MSEITMTKEEMLRVIRSGLKITHILWPSEKFIFIEENHIYNHKQEIVDYFFYGRNSPYDHETGWLVYNPKRERNDHQQPKKHHDVLVSTGSPNRKKEIKVMNGYLYDYANVIQRNKITTKYRDLLSAAKDNPKEKYVVNCMDGENAFCMYDEVYYVLIMNTNNQQLYHVYLEEEDII